MKKFLVVLLLVFVPVICHAERIPVDDQGTMFLLSESVRYSQRDSGLFVWPGRNPVISGTVVEGLIVNKFEFDTDTEKMALIDTTIFNNDNEIASYVKQSSKDWFKPLEGSRSYVYCWVAYDFSQNHNQEIIEQSKRYQSIYR